MENLSSPKLVNISAKRVARLGQKRYRTARNHRNTFRPTILLNLRFRRKKGFFAEKCSFFTKFAFCRVFKIVLFLEKNREFLKKKFFIKYYFIRILQRICHLFQILKKSRDFFQQTTNLFSQRKKILCVHLRNPSSIFAVYGKLTFLLRLKFFESVIMPFCDIVHLASKRQKDSCIELRLGFKRKKNDYNHYNQRISVVESFKTSLRRVCPKAEKNRRS